MGGRYPPQTTVSDHVLSDFNEEELVKIRELAPAVVEMLISIIKPDPE
jgi:peptidyl-tRNA hydrolase